MSTDTKNPTAAAAAATNLKLKLLVDVASHRVLFAEAGNDVIEFLFSLLVLPLSTVTRLLTEEQMFRSLGNIYASLDALDVAYLNQPSLDRVTLLNPKSTVSPSLFLDNSASSSSSSAEAEASKRYFRCHYDYVTNVYGTKCPVYNCAGKMTTEVRFVPGAAEVQDDKRSGADGKGFVKGLITYMVMDDLTVSPMSTISAIALLNKFDVKDVSSLRERRVDLGMKEGLELLKASLQSTTVLTDVFLGKPKGCAAPVVVGFE